MYLVVRNVQVYVFGRHKCSSICIRSPKTFKYMYPVAINIQIYVSCRHKRSNICIRSPLTFKYMYPVAINVQIYVSSHHKCSNICILIIGARIVNTNSKYKEDDFTDSDADDYSQDVCIYFRQ